MNKLNGYLFLVLSALFFTSCIGNKKITALRQTIDQQKKTETKLDSTILSLNNFRAEKNNLGELDDTSNLAIQKLLNKEVDSIKIRTSNLGLMEEKLIGKRIKGREYKNMIVILTNGSSVLSQKMETVDFVDQLLKQQTFIKFNTGAFFPPGGYKIDPAKLPDAKIAFAPLIDSLIAFVLRFPNFKLTSSIVSSGYADGTGFSPGELVNTLTANIGKSEATKEELNLELSRLRAEEITGILTDIFKEKISNIPKLTALDSRFYKTGKGEEYPNKKIKDYQISDDRRRIVVIYWNALPV